MTNATSSGQPAAEFALPWRDGRRFRLHLPISAVRIEELTHDMAGTRLTAAERRRLMWFRSKCAARWVGWISGTLTGAIVLISAVVLALSFVFKLSAAAGLVSSVSGVVIEACAVGFFVWAYLYVAPVAFDPPTNFARSAMETARHLPSGSAGWQIGIGYGVANLSGKTARSLMAVLTGRQINIAGRPDVARHAAEVAEGIMLVVPTEGLTFWQSHTHSANGYAKLLHDINGLIAIGRPELIPETIQRCRQDVATDIFVVPDSPDVRRYLHPLAETTAVEATVRYLVPLVTMAVAIATLFLAAGKH